MVNAWRQRGTRWGAKQGAGAVARIIVDIKGVPFCELRASHPTHSSFPKVKRPRPRVLVQTGDRERSEKKERNEGNEENEKKKKKISRRAAERSGEEGDCVAWHRVGVESGWKDKKEIDRRGGIETTRRDAMRRRFVETVRVPVLRRAVSYNEFCIDLRRRDGVVRGTLRERVAEVKPRLN